MYRLPRPPECKRRCADKGIVIILLYITYKVGGLAMTVLWAGRFSSRGMKGMRAAHALHSSPQTLNIAVIASSASLQKRLKVETCAAFI